MSVALLRSHGGQHMRTRGRRSAGRTEKERQLQQLARLQRQITEQRRKIAEMERVRDEMLRRGAGSVAYEGVCAECGIGVIVRKNDSLRCTSCDFHYNL